MSEEPAQNAEATAPESMADIAGSIQEPMQQQESAAPEQQVNDNVSDMDSFIQQQSKRFDDLANKASQSMETVNQLAAREQQRLLNEAVDNAVEKINEGVNGDNRLADSFLNSQYQRDPNFKRVFDNRDSNPQAYEKALGLLRDEWASMNKNRIDPQVAENQRALRESQQSGSTYVQNDRETELSNMSDGDFMREMRRLANSG